MAAVKKPTSEEWERFNQLRQEQRAVVQQMSKIEAEKAEHAITIEALKEVDKNRTCFRLVGGVLIERTVGEVLPALQKNHDQLSTFVEKLNEQLVEKGKTIAQYSEKHNINAMVRGQKTGADDGENPAVATKADGDKTQASGSTSGVLVPSS